MCTEGHKCSYVLLNELYELCLFGLLFTLDFHTLGLIEEFCLAVKESKL